MRSSEELQMRVDRLRRYAARFLDTHRGDHYQGLEDALAIADALAIRPDGEEPADSTWAEAVGFEWADETAMYRYVGTGKVLKVLLTGDLTMCEKARGLSLYWSNYPHTPRHSWTFSVDDNPTRDRVRLLFAGLGCPLEEKAREERSGS